MKGFDEVKKHAAITDMTVGSPYKLILAFSIPLLIGNIFQQLYNMVDSIVVGNFVGEKALAAVGTGFPVIFMLSSLFMGIGMGATVMISQFYGAKDYENIQNTVSTIYTALLIGSVPLAVIGVLISRPLLLLMQVPDDGTLEMATSYMIIIFIGIIGSLGFNINAGILQGLGDSRSSLYFLMIATVINIVLDLFFTIVIHMGCAGVALATIIAQIVSWVLGIIYINKHYSFFRIRPFSFFFHKAIFIKAMKLGIPSGLQQALFSVGIMVMQTLVNSYGSNFMAGFNGANKLDTFAFMPIQSFSTAMTTYVGQNVGAGKLDRVKQGTHSGLLMSVGFSIIIAIIVLPFSAVLMRMFNQNPEVINAGVCYLRAVMPFYAIFAMMFIFNSVLRGAGEMIVPLISSLLSLWLARVPTAYLIAHFWGKDYIYFSYAVGWVIGLAVSYFAYRSGKWKTKGITGVIPS